MLDDKLAATDWEATQDELLQQIARESYLQWLRENNQRSQADTMVRTYYTGQVSRFVLGRMEGERWSSALHDVCVCVCVRCGSKRSVCK